MTDFPVRIVLDDAQATQRIGRLERRLQSLERTTGDAQGGARRLSDSLRRSGEASERNAAFADRLTQAQQRGAQATQRASQAQRQATNTTRAATDAGERFRASLQRSQRAGTAWQRAIRRLNVSMRLHVRNVRQGLVSAYRQLPATISRAAASIGRTLPAALSRVVVAAGAATAAMGPLGIALGVVTLGFGALALAAVKLGTPIAEAGDRARILQIRLTSLTGSERALELARASAEKLGLSLQDVADPLSRIAAGGREIGLTAEQINEVNETVLQLGRLSGTTSEGLRAVGLQLAQGITAGVTGEELRTFREQIPELGQLIAAELGEKSTANLKKLAAEGKITGEVLARALLRASGNIERRFAELPNTLEKSRQRLSDSFGRLLETLDEQLGLSKIFQFFTDLITKGVDLANRLLGGTNIPSAETIAETTQQASTDVPGLGGPSNELTKARDSLSDFLADLEQTPAQLRLQAQGIGQVGVQAAGELARANAELQLQQFLQEQNRDLDGERLELSAEQKRRFAEVTDEIVRQTEALQRAEDREFVRNTFRGLDQTIADLANARANIDNTAGATARWNEEQRINNALRARSQTLDKDAADALQEYLDTLERGTDALEDAKRERALFLSIRGGEIELARNMEALERAADKYGLTAEEVARKQRELNQQFLQTQTDGASGLQRAFNDLADEGEDAASRVETAFKDSFREIEDTLFEFFDTGKFGFDQFVNDIRRILLRLAVEDFTAPLKKALSGAQASNGGGGGGFDALISTGIGLVAGAFGGDSGISGLSGGVTGATNFGGSTLSASELFGFAGGGSFAVGPNSSLATLPGVDNRLIAFKARDRERVTVTTPEQDRAQFRPGDAFHLHFHGIRDEDGIRRNSGQIAAGMQSMFTREYARNRLR